MREGPVFPFPFVKSLVGASLTEAWRSPSLDDAPCPSHCRFPYRVSTHDRCLLAQAPTGIGKTVGALHPLLCAVPGQGIDKVAFLT